MGLYTRLCAAVLFPLHERLKGHDSVALRRRLEVSQWWTAEQIAADQAQRLRLFLVDIGQHVPYYRELFARTGFDPQRVASAADLQRLPLLGKTGDTRPCRIAQARGARPADALQHRGLVGRAAHLLHRQGPQEP